MSTRKHLRIGFVGNVPPPIGGAEVFLQQFLKRFISRPGRSAVLARWRRQIFMYFPERLVRVYAPRGKVSEFQGLKTHYLFEATQRRPKERKSAYDARVQAHYLLQAEEAASIFARERVQLIHTHMLFPNVLFGMAAAEALGVPHAVTIHGMLEFRLLDHFRKDYPRFADRVEVALSQADIVVAVSEEIARECKRRKAKRVMKLSGGVDTEMFRPVVGQSEGENIVFLGSIRKEKGADLLIEAFEQCRGRWEGDLIFVGRLLLPRSMVARAKKHPRIHFLGEQDSFGVRRALVQAKLVALPSASEGLPMSILEAMACQKPVLATATGDLPRLIDDGKNGFLLRRRTAEALAQRIAGISRRSDLASIGRAARRTAESFDIRRVVDRYENLYVSLIQ